MGERMADTRRIISIYLQPAFVICVAVLAIAGSGMSVAVRSFGVYLKKAPLPLKKSLDRLDEEGLGPYRVLSEDKIENEEIVKSLGTKEYIQWRLEDSEAAVDSPVRRCFLFITYYELPDRVPHVPEECYAGSGYQRLASEDVTLEINRGDYRERIAARHLVFASRKADYWGRDTKFSALYLFNVNGVYTNRREDARLVLGKNIFGKHSYFSKVEWSFNTGLGAKVYLSREEAVVASQKLLNVILPILESEHWPVLAKAKKR